MSITLFIEVGRIYSNNATTVCTILKQILARHGIPKIIMTDNGPPFNSAEFEKFAKSWMFKHQTSSPHYSQSNGQVESMVKVVKNMLRKSELDGTDFYLSLLELMNTPISNNIPSPAQILYSRR